MIAPTATESSKPTATLLGSKISAVTVYRSGARIIREASLPTPPRIEDGAASLRFDGLPLSLMDSSLRCRVLGAPGARATELRCELRLLDARSKPGVGKSEERKALEIKVEQLRSRVAFVQEEISLKLTLGERGKPALGDAPMKSPFRARVETLRALGERSETLDAELHKLGEELRLAEIAFDELEATEAIASTDHGSRPGEMRKSVVVLLQGAEHAVNGRIEIEYFVPGAKWAPSYSLRLGASLRAGELAMRAMVSQRSGEDWNGVNLTLSTADHQKWAEIPELNSKRIGRRQPTPPKKGWRAPPTGTDLLYRDYDTSFGGPVSDSPIGMLGGAIAGAYGADTKQEFGRDEPMASLSQGVSVDYDDLDDDDYPDEAFGAEEFDDARTVVMEEVSLSANYVADKEMDEPPGEVMASLMAPPMPRAAPRRSRMKKSKAAMAPAQVSGGRVGAPLRKPVPSNPAPPQVDLDLMQYARLRMAGPGIRSRGTLRVFTQLQVYAEIFMENGVDFAPDTQDYLERAQYIAHDIAAMPTGHSEPWSEEFDYAYHAENTVDLESDGQFHSLPIASSTANCVPLHVVVPRESTDVFRTVKVDNPMDAPLLSGPMDVYWDDAFLLTSSVAFTAPKGQVELGLGVEQAVKVVRNTHYREDTSGLMGGSLELSHKIVIEVANEGGHEISLEVRERVPVAAEDEDDIKLDIKTVSPTWSAYEPETKDVRDAEAKGMYRWQIPLTAGERKELSATYEIKMPSKYELQGGNRREW